MTKRNVVFGFLDPFWDRDIEHPSTGRWRPTVEAVCAPDLHVDRVELLVQNGHEALLAEVRRAIGQASPQTAVREHWHVYRDLWDFEEVYAYLHDVVSDYPFDLDAEDYFVHMSTGTHVMRICVFLLAESNFLPARILQTHPKGAYGDPERAGIRIIDLDLAKYDQIARRFAFRRQQGTAFLKTGIQTRNPAFNRMIEEIESVAIASSDPILLMGPTGAGKSHLAERIAELKRRRFQNKGEFVPVNCATLRGDGAMSALFGHRRGAFTGAVSDRSGLLKRANGGVLFLDEIGELGAEEQAMLLRAMETGRFYPVGSDNEEQSRFQLIAGTNRNLKKDSLEGKFRLDLLARINQWTYHLPSLTDRREDIEPNVSFELEAFAQRHGRLVSFNSPARRKFLDFAVSGKASWTGNFRDLAASINRMATLAPGGRISEEIVDREIARLESEWNPDPDRKHESPDPALPGELLDRIDRFERVRLIEAVKVCRNSRSLAEAGRALFDVSRKKRGSSNDSDRIRKYLARFGLDWGSVIRTG
jgi:transcriptional regulatory protein RtcR